MGRGSDDAPCRSHGYVYSRIIRNSQATAYHSHSPIVPVNLVHLCCTSTRTSEHQYPLLRSLFSTLPRPPPVSPTNAKDAVTTVEGFWIGMRCQMGDVSLLLPARGVMFSFSKSYHTTCFLFFPSPGLGGLAMVNRNFPIGYIIVV